MVHAKIENHQLILFMREPLETYKRVKRAHCLGGKGETRRSDAEVRRELKCYKSRGHARSTTIKGNKAVVCRDVASKLKDTSPQLELH